MFRFRYANRILFIILAAGIGGLLLQRFLVPASFGQYGHYRGKSLTEEAALPVVHQGKTICQECHPDVFEAHERDVHVSVECENCHGNGERHVDFYKTTETKVTASEARMTILQDNQTCLFCHRQLQARPRHFPQIDPEAHFALLKVKDKSTTCFSCHSPHEPLFQVKKITEARVHPTIHECKSCHDTPVSDPRPARHPIVFDCAYCHKGMVQDFQTKKHRFLNCTSCHNVYRISESAGYIFKNGNPKFCLMCHEDKNVVDPAAVPVIKPAEHYEMMGAAPEMTCYDCHGTEKIHDAARNPFAAAPAGTTPASATAGQDSPEPAGSTTAPLPAGQ